MSATQSFSLDEVVEALRGLIDAVDQLTRMSPIVKTNWRSLSALDKARAVLAKVGGA